MKARSCLAAAPDRFAESRRGRHLHRGAPQGDCDDLGRAGSAQAIHHRLRAGRCRRAGGRAPAVADGPGGAAGVAGGAGRTGERGDGGDAVLGLAARSAERGRDRGPCGPSLPGEADLAGTVQDRSAGRAEAGGPGADQSAAGDLGGDAGGAGAAHAATGPGVPGPDADRREEPDPRASDRGEPSPRGERSVRAGRPRVAAHGVAVADGPRAG